MIIMSIDPGIKNFCFCIENYSPFGNQSTLELENTSLSDNGKRLTETVLNKITNIIRSQFLKYTITLVLIERQPPIAHNNTRIMQHIWTLIHTLFPETKIELYSPSLKTQVYGMHFSNYYQRKKWAVSFAKDLIFKRGDLVTLEKLSVKKADDMADCILMINSWYLTKHSINK